MKNGFTLLELVVVVAIFGVLFGVTRTFLTMEDQNPINAETCVNSIYGEVDKFFNSARTSRNISLSDGTYASPEEYRIVFTGDKNASNSGNVIGFFYNTGNSFKKYKTISLDSTGDLGNEFECFSNQYKTQLSGDMTVTFQKGLESNVKTNGATITTNGSDSFTGSVYFYYRKPPYTYHSPGGTNTTGDKIISRFLFDMRVEDIRHSRCIQRINSGMGCDNRSQSF